MDPFVDTDNAFINFFFLFTFQNLMNFYNTLCVILPWYQNTNQLLRE